MIELDDVAVQLAQTLKTMVIERTALVTAEASAEEIAHKDAVIDTVRQAQALILLKASQDREEKDRAAKYAKIYPEACRLKEEMGNAFHAHERANLEYVTAEKNLQSAEVALSEHMGNKPRPETFPSARAKASWETRRQAFEKHTDERKEIVRQKKEEMGEARQEHERLKNAFDLASFQCRHYGPRTPTAQPVPIAWTVPSSLPSRTTNSPV
jgi:hypothetical protein